jgi:hypothetical protein
VSTTPAINEKILKCKFFHILLIYRQDSLIAGVVDTAKKFFSGDVDTAEQFFRGVVDTCDKFQAFWLLMTGINDTAGKNFIAGVVETAINIHSRLSPRIFKKS